MALVKETEVMALEFVVLTTSQPLSTNVGNIFATATRIDNELVYEQFYYDFGPLNLSKLYRYCKKLNEKLRSKYFDEKIIVHYTTLNKQKRANAAFLIASYSVMYLKKTPEEAYRLLTSDGPSFVPFRDASLMKAKFHITLLHCLEALYKAMTLGFFNFKDFDVDEYEFYEQVENGDLNWIVPQKFLAFCGPHAKTMTKDDYPYHGPEAYFDYFKKNNVSTIVRLNQKQYSQNKFIKEGFVHKDLFFRDGSTPSDEIMNQFLTVSLEATGAIAVHCKAGLGRTGCLIACYIMRYFHFSAQEAIAWIRICRPGSIIGEQHRWLVNKQDELWLNSRIPSKRAFGIYSIKWKKLNSSSPGSSFESTLSFGYHKINTVQLNGRENNSQTVQFAHDNNGTVEESEEIQEGMSLMITQGDKLNQIKARRMRQRAQDSKKIISTKTKNMLLRSSLTKDVEQAKANSHPTARQVLSPVIDSKVNTVITAAFTKMSGSNTARRSPRSTSVHAKRAKTGTAMR
uniref:protein-tyrosine-phosphatase n=1 Tax=Timema californicum TaxID=61474 RepID=A0A7R9JBQ8_TIMCA|nr:unnamed protein product [Timema californicum]